MSEQYRPPPGPPPNKRSRVDSHNGQAGQSDQSAPSSREQTVNPRSHDTHMLDPQVQHRSDRPTPEYDPPPGPPPGWQPKDVEMGSATSDSTLDNSSHHSERYEPPPGPPPSHRNNQEPPAYDPWHDSFDAPHPPPSFTASHPLERSPAANASSSDAARGHEWCRSNSLWRARAPDSRTLPRIAAGDLRLTTPPTTTDLTEYQPARGKTYLRSMSPRLSDTILLSDHPVYVAQAHSPAVTGAARTVYYEIQILNVGGEDRYEKKVDSGVAIGFVAPPYPAWRLPGWHRGSLGVHGDDGNRYVDDSRGGRPFVQPFAKGDVVGIGITYQPPTQQGGLMQAEVFFTRNGRREAGWDLHEERDAHVEEGEVEGLEGNHDLLAAVGVFGFVEIETRFAREDWMFVP